MGETMKKAIKDFEYMTNLAKAKALSNISLERELTDDEFEQYKNVMDVVKNGKNRSSL